MSVDLAVNLLIITAVVLANLPWLVNQRLFLFIPLKIEQPEILARISPNILDLFIAIFSAIIALLSL